MSVAPPQAPSVQAELHVTVHRPRTSARKIRAGIGKHAVLIALSVTFAIPLLWMVSSSFKTAVQAIAMPVVWFPHPFLWSNYSQLFAAQPFFRYFWNTFLYAAVTIVGVCIS
ncbi:MAG: hypothetical protein LBV34_16950, partial [Nocardiopsaceae bacterium]|nr:hypothetical protein [Nocardiopsaceae bacterium]